MTAIRTRTRRHGLALAAAVALGACGDATREAIEAERESADLVVGSAAAEWGLLTIPRAAGTADLRPVMHPDSIVWHGTAELPVVTGAWPLGDAAVLLRTEAGDLVRYEPPTDELTPLAGVSEDARLTASGSGAAVFVDSGGRYVHEVRPDVEHGYSFDEPVAWAGPTDGGVAVLTSEGGRLLLLHRADSSVTADIPDAGRAPALVTAWGRRVVTTAPDGRAVRVWAVDEEGRLVGEAEIDGEIRALGASPSSHEIYVATEAPSRLVRISRFSLESERLADLPGAADALRPGLFGGSLLVRSAGGPLRVPAGGGRVDALPGEWRFDLPIGLPGDLSIVAVDDEARLVSVADSGGATLAGGAPRWWIPLRFNPSVGQEADLREALEELGAAAGAPGEARDEADDEAGEAGDEVEMPDVGGGETATREVPAGYYAIVISARERGGAERLTASLADSGFPTRIQTFPDEAGDVWHRGLVGPYPSRARAQAAARQLLREHDLQAWVTEIGAGE